MTKKCKEKMCRRSTSGFSFLHFYCFLLRDIETALAVAFSEYSGFIPPRNVRIGVCVCMLCAWRSCMKVHLIFTIKRCMLAPLGINISMLGAVSPAGNKEGRYCFIL